MRLPLLFILAIICFEGIAQAPKGINYQGIARDAEGKPLAQREISIRISILNGSASGEVEYDETHELRTNSFGLFTLVIGKGTPGTGTFNFISWALGDKWLQIELDENGGRNFKLMGSQQLMSVPYALYAEYAGNGYSAGDGISISNNMISNTGDNDNSPTNELITGLSLTGDNKLRITDAGGTKEVDMSGLAGTSQNLSSVLAQGNNAGGSIITNLGTPVSAADAATKVYVDSHVDGDASATNEIQNLSQVLTQNNDAGGTRITNLGTPTANADAATKLYVDNLDATDGDKSSTNEIQNIAQVLAQNNNTGGAKITGLGSPTTNTDAATKLYVDNLDAADGDKSSTNEIQNLSQVLTQNNDAGGAKISNLGAPTVNADAATKLYVDNLDATDGDKSSTNEIQNIAQVLAQNNNTGGAKITGLGTPTANTDAATKKYVDDADAILASKISTTYAFKANYDFTHSSTGTQVVTIASVDIDDFSVISSNKFTAPENGIYQFTVSGTSILGGIAMQIRLTEALGPISTFDVKRQLGYPTSSIVNYYESTILKLNAGDKIDLIVSSGLIGEVVSGVFYGFKL